MTSWFKVRLPGQCDRYLCVLPGYYSSIVSHNVRGPIVRPAVSTLLELLNLKFEELQKPTFGHFDWGWLSSTWLRFPKQLNFTEKPTELVNTYIKGTVSHSYLCCRDPVETRHPEVSKWRYHKLRAHLCEWEHFAGWRTTDGVLSHLSYNVKGQKRPSLSGLPGGGEVWRSGLGLNSVWVGLLRCYSGQIVRHEWDLHDTDFVNKTRFDWQNSIVLHTAFVPYQLLHSYFNKMYQFFP